MAAHNRKILENNQTDTNAQCNLQVKEACPVKNQCQTEAVIFKAKVKATNAYYIGMTSKSFKTRFNQH